MKNKFFVFDGKSSKAYAAPINDDKQPPLHIVAVVKSTIVRSITKLELNHNSSRTVFVGSGIALMMMMIPKQLRENNAPKHRIISHTSTWCTEHATKKTKKKQKHEETL